MFDTAPFTWAVIHFSYIGWPALIYTCYRVIVLGFKFARTATLVEQRVLKGEETLYLLATNHLPHIQVAIENSDKTAQETNKVLQGIREDLRLLMVKN